MLQLRWLLMLPLALLVVGLSASPGQAQKSAPEMSESDQKLESLLDEAELFYKKSYNEQAQRWEFKIAWSEKGETTVMNVYLRSMGTRGDGSPIPVVYGWTQVMSAGSNEELPPAVIKMVAAANDGLSTGNLSTAGNGVYANTGIVLQDLSSDAMWLHLWDLHYTRIRAKAEIDKILGN